MVRMGPVWDRTLDVLRGRGGILMQLAMLYLFVPNVVASLIGLVMPAGGIAAGVAALLSGLVSLAASVLLIIGVLAITAVASDPQVDAPRAQAIAVARLLPALAAVALLILAVIAIGVPVAVSIIWSGATFDPVSGRFDLSGATGGSLNLAGLLTVVAVVLGLWASLRLAPLFAVIVNERRGLGAARRSIRLTRGSTLRLLGVVILYGIVVIVALAAATSVIGLAARLLLGSGAGAWVGFIVSVVSAAVTAVATVVQSVFYARFYVAARDATDGAATGGGAAPDLHHPR